MLTDFAHWYPLSEAASRAPEGPGVYQVKVRDGLLSYPTGKSAMVCYGSSDALRTAVAEVAAQHPDSRFLCRHQSTAAPAVLLDFVLGQFVRRFGSAPTWPSQAPAQAEEQDVP